MEIHTQDDFIVAIIATSLRADTLDEASEGFLQFVQHIRSEEEKFELVTRAEKLLVHDAILPSREKLKELSKIFFDLPKDGWEMFERQHNCH